VVFGWYVNLQIRNSELTKLGNYIISGGTETVLVLWQLDTGKQQFLPHMTATIQNVTVSPSGSSYGVQLADNSTMVLSVAELTPTANIAGIQARILEYEDPVDSSVRRVEEDSFQPALFQHTSAVVNPANPSQLLLGVGPTQRVSHNKPLITSIPYLQTFDLGTGHGESRQALARTNITNINIAPNAHQISEPRVVHMQTSFDGTWLATVDEWIPPKRDLDFIGHQGKDLEGERRQRREVFLKFWQWSKENGDWELVTRIDAPHASTDASGAGRILDLAADPSSTRFSTIGDDAVVRIWSLKMRKRDGIPVRWKDGTALRNWNCQHSVSIGKSEFLNENARPPLDACVAFSEDGSVLAAACGKQNDGLLHLLDPELGTVRSSRTGLFEGPILKMEFLGQDLITVSDRIVVYDLVVDDIRCGIQLAPAVTSLSTQQKMEMVHLAVDRRSQTFAVALPATFASHTYGEQSLLNRYSELAVFHQDRLKPVFVESFSTLITTLLPAVGSEGYLVLDSAAEIRTVLRQGTQAVTSLAQSTSALHLDIAEETSGDLLRLAENEEEEEAGDVEAEVEVKGPQSHADALDHDPDENPVVTQQQLSEVFDIGPSFALPPMEDMFYQVAALFGSKVSA
jgi:NET1-associated nuclear protein 1 (U3 small nucleolar RNA-associated protein 17)